MKSERKEEILKERRKTRELERKNILCLKKGREAEIERKKRPQKNGRRI